MGGQTALNVAMKLSENGVLEKYGVELIGAKARAIKVAEDRARVWRRDAAHRPQGRRRGASPNTWDEALAIAEFTGFPAIIRPSFTLGGSGGGIAYNREEYEDDRPARAGRVADEPGADRALACSAGRSSSSR